MEPSGGSVEGAVGAVGPESVTDQHEGDGDGGSHAAYMAVWGGLAVLTLIEVWVAGTGLTRGLLIGVLVGLAVWKAALVALYYMHLKFEPSRLWVLALAPLPLPFILVLVVMQEF